MNSNWQWNSTKRKIDDSQDDLKESYYKYYKLNAQIFTSPPTITNQLQQPTEPTTLFVECTLSPACKNILLYSIQEYELHYSKFHINNCSICQKTLPTAHILHLHLLEIHDSFFKANAIHKNMYECFVEDCLRKFKSPRTRIMHLIDKHKFPKDFDFKVIMGTFHPKNSHEISNYNIPKATESCPKNNPSNQNTDMLVDSFSKLSIPRSVQLLKNKKH